MRRLDQYSRPNFQFLFKKQFEKRKMKKKVRCMINTILPTIILSSSINRICEYVQSLFSPVQKEGKMATWVNENSGSHSHKTEVESDVLAHCSPPPSSQLPFDVSSHMASATFVVTTLQFTISAPASLGFNLKFLQLHE